MPGIVARDIPILSQSGLAGSVSPAAISMFEVADNVPDCRRTHQLRLVLATQPAEGFRQYGPALQLPNSLTPTPEQLFNLVGGIYTFSLGPSAINLSTAQEADLVPSARDWGPVN